MNQITSAKHEGLKIVQFEEWPSTVLLTDKELIDSLALDRAYQDEAAWRRHIEQCWLFYPDGVGYSVTDGMGRKCYGFRFGFNGHEYASF